jgi:hypothetical protein
MKQLHPNCCYTALSIALLAAVCQSGCRSQPSAMANPFLSPDRVPPPATRMVAPGTAQPYYPGDPLPSVQSATTPEPPADPIAPSDHPPPQPFVAHHESSVAIPRDDGQLRFALPPPPQVAEATPQPTIELIATVAGQAPNAPSTSQVIPAAYNDTTAYQVAASESVEAAAAANGPWRSPQIRSPNVPPPANQNFYPTVSPPAFAAGPQPFQQPLVQQLTATMPPLVSTMPVQLRAVPSPPLDAATSAPPRIRFAAANAPWGEPGTVASNQVAQAGYVAPPQGVPIQTVYVAQLPPGATLAPISAAPAESLPTVSTDGFRARGSTW